MATITNRSNFVVTVPRRPEHERSFAFDAKNAIATYVAALHKQGLKPKIVQLEDSLLVQIRRVGHPDQTETFTSATQADAFVKRIESEQTQGLFIDYTAAPTSHLQTPSGNTSLKTARACAAGRTT